MAGASRDTERNNTEDRSVPNDDEDDSEDTTCCHRATFCNPLLREINVKDAIVAWHGHRVTWANLFWLASSAAMVFTGWAVLYFLLGDAMLPGGSNFGLFSLVVFSYALGWSLAYVPHLNLPPVFGMLLAGIIVRNTGFYDIHEELGPGPTAKIRTFCLTFIMMRAGLQLTTTALREHPVFVMLLALVPCSVEMLVLSICCRYVLGYPWDWAFMTGAIVACMSPVVTVNCMLALAERGYGEDKGMATLLCTAASIDDVHIVSLFSIFYSIVFSDDEHRTEWWSYIPAGIRDLLLGVIVGFALGFFFIFFPHRNHKHATWYRIGSLVLGCLMCTTAASKFAVTGGGYIATIIMSFIAITGWRVLTVSYNTLPLRRIAYYLWHFMQPILVGVIGADIDFRDWSLTRFGYYLICISVGLAARSVVAFLTTLRTRFSWKERVFVAFSWMPKGTLQAALAPMAFERARKEDDIDRIELALDVVRISVVAIVFLAPLGAIVMMTSGPLMLNQISEEERQRDRELSYLRIMSLQPVRTRKQKKSSVSEYI